MVSDTGVKLNADKNHIITTEKEPKEGKDTYRITVTTNWQDVVGFRLEALSGERLPERGPGRAPDGNFVLSEFSVEDASSNRIAWAAATATFEAPGFPASAAADGQHEPENGWAVRGMTGVEQSIYFATQGWGFSGSDHD